MPTKSKLPRNKVPAPKLANLPPRVQQNGQSSSTESTEAPTSSGLNREAEDQFELELCWCVQQLESAIKDVKLQEKQAYNITKSLNVLKSNNASLIRKRQIMRNTFGDYRTRMSEDAKKFGKSAAVVKFTPDSKKTKERGIFFKRACGVINTPVTSQEDETQNQSKTKAIMNPAVSHEPFKFNFSVDNS